MPRPCSICTHPQQEAIDKALVGGESFRGISRKYFGTAKREDALSRHKELHLPTTVAKAEATRQVEHARGVVAEGLDVVGQLRAINGITLHVLKEARDTRDHDTVLKAVDRVQRQIELQAKLLGALDERPPVNILIAPQWIEVRAVILRALMPYPEARAALAGALAEVDRAGV